jgi:hypothetical protein
MRILLLLLITSFSAFGQNSLRLRVQDTQQEALPFATVLLRKTADSSLVKGMNTDEFGVLRANKLPLGSFTLTIQSTGLKSIKIPLDELKLDTQLDLGTITLSPLNTELSEVTVSATKPFIEKKLDKTIVNVENSAMAAGNTTMELLERSPGVIVDKDGNISLRGKSGANIMIDGKISYLSGADLANYLKNLPADQISQLEIMANPSSKYDAAGTGGLINIKLKKNANIGLNGSANATLAQGVYTRESAGVNVNYRKNGWNWFGNASFVNRIVLERNNLTRNFAAQNEVWENGFAFKNENQSSQFKGGVDWAYSKKTTFGLLFSGNLNQYTLRNGLNQTVQYNAIREALLKLNTYNQLTNPSHNYAGNFNFKHSYDSTGRELTIDLDYARFADNSTSNLRSQFLRGDNQSLRPDSLLANQSRAFVDQYSVKLDYVIPTYKAHKWALGLKSSYVKTDNDLQFRGKNETEANFQFLTGQSNRFQYIEQIHAAYLNAERAIGKFSYQLGLRGEWTLADGRSQAYTPNAKDITFKRDYAQLFPSAFLQYELSKNNSIGLNYSRRIDRPSYGDLNPFVFFLDNYTFKVGNPWLIPQLTNSLELSHTYMGAFSTTLGYSQTSNVITEILKQDTEARKSFQTTANIAERKNYSLGFSLPIPIKKWWTSNTDIYLNRAELSGRIDENAISPSQNMFYFNTNHIFTLPKDFRFEIGGNYFSGGLESAFIFGAGGSLNMGIQKTVLNKRGVIRLNAQDILYTSNPNVFIKYGDLDIIVRPRQDSRVVRLNFSYRFGNMAIKGARERSTGLDAEKSRVKTK